MLRTLFQKRIKTIMRIECPLCSAMITVGEFGVAVKCPCCKILFKVSGYIRLDAISLMMLEDKPLRGML